jgi:nucleoid-associated protein EbfC
VNIKKLMKQAQQMQEQMQEQMKETTVEGSAGGGMVKVTLNGQKDVLKVTLDPEILKPEEREMVEDLILAAFKDAQEKVEQHLQGMMGALSGGLGLG